MGYNANLTEEEKIELEKHSKEKEEETEKEILRRIEYNNTERDLSLVKPINPEDVDYLKLDWIQIVADARSDAQILKDNAIIQAVEGLKRYMFSFIKKTINGNFTNMYSDIISELKIAVICNLTSYNPGRSRPTYYFMSHFKNAYGQYLQTVSRHSVHYLKMQKKVKSVIEDKQKKGMYYSDVRSGRYGNITYFGPGDIALETNYSLQQVMESIDALNLEVGPLELLESNNVKSQFESPEKSVERKELGENLRIALDEVRKRDPEAVEIFLNAGNIEDEFSKTKITKKLNQKRALNSLHGLITKYKLNNKPIKELVSLYNEVEQLDIDNESFDLDFSNILNTIYTNYNLKIQTLNNRSTTKKYNFCHRELFNNPLLKEYKTARKGNKIKVKKEIDTSNEAYDFASLMSELSPSLFEEEKNTNSFFNV